MTDFTTTQGAPTQEHFYVVSIVLPIVTGKCELTPGVEGFGTPLSCPIQDGTSATVEKTYMFATTNAPTDLPFSPIYHCLSGVTETGTELTSGRGLALRGRATINFIDFKNDDPNLERASAQAIKDQGTFFGKYSARNIFENRSVQIGKYRKAPGVNLATDGEITTYIGRELNSNGKSGYTLQCADALSKVDFDQSQFPPASNGSLISDIDDTTTTLPVDSLTDWESKPFPYVIIVGDELMTALSVVDNLTATAAITVKSRGQDIGTPEFTTFISQVRTDEHKMGDDVFICYHADQRNIAQVFRDILISVDIDSAIIPIGDWVAEVDTWLATNTMTTIIYEVGNTNDLLSQMLSNYMLDMWYDPVLNDIKLKAVSEFQESTGEIVEGISADFETVKVKQMEELRYSRALIAYDKPFIADREENTSYKKASLAIRPELELPELYGNEKLRNFRDARWLDKDSADLLTRRFLQRYGQTPDRIKWRTQEKYRDFSVGDVRNLTSFEKQGFDGSPDSTTRVQITKIQPVFDQLGRFYNVEALSYIGEASLTSTITNGIEINLFIIAGAPPEAVDFRFIFDDGQFSSSDINIPSVRAGGFAPGSKLTITYVNGADHQGKGGNGRNNDTSVVAEPGGPCYDAEGIDTDIYLGGVDPFGTTANGFIRAPGGGGGGTIAGSYLYSGLSFPNVQGDLTPQFLDIGGITDDGEFLWILLRNDLSKLHKYSRDGVYQNVSIQLSGGAGLGLGIDIIFDGTHFWILYWDLPSMIVERYGVDGVFTGDSKDLSIELGDCRGIGFSNGNMYAASLTADSVFEYSLAGAVFTYTGFNFDVSAEMPLGPSCVAANNERVFVSLFSGGTPNNFVYVYDRATGVFTGAKIFTEQQMGNNYLSMVFSDGLYILSPGDVDSGTDQLLTSVFKYTGGGGGGGAGINIGTGHETEVISVVDGDTVGNGGNGTNTNIGFTFFDSGSGGNWGEQGDTGTSGFVGGLAGKGIVKSGAVVRVFGDTPTNFINGNGDTPDP